MLLGDLAGGVRRCAGRAARPRRPAPSPSGAAADAGSGSRSRPPPARRPSRGGGAWSPCSGQRVAALAVDHHRRGQHQPVDARARASPPAARRCRGRCGAAYSGRSADRHAGADHRGLVADHVDAVEQVGPGGRRRGRRAGGCPPAASAAPCAIGSIRSTRTTSWPSRLEHRADRGADEAGRAGEQDPHGHLVGAGRCRRPRSSRCSRRGRAAPSTRWPAARSSRSRLRANSAKTSSWPTPSPPSTPASMSVTSAIAA